MEMEWSQKTADDDLLQSYVSPRSALYSAAAIPQGTLCTLSFKRDFDDDFTILYLWSDLKVIPSKVT